LAAQLYDEILFNGVTFADRYRAGGPKIAVSATDLATGSRILFIPQNFNVMCSDLGPIRLSRATPASPAMPVVLSPLTINNYGGSCDYRGPGWLRAFTALPKVPRPAARVLMRRKELRAIDNGVKDPYLRLADRASPIIWACAECWMYLKRTKPCMGPVSQLRWTTYV
jgi:NTE family protein